MNEALVSIIIPVYNAEKFLAETLSSALAQTWPNKEIIVVNDGSTDGSADIVNAFGSSQVVLITQSNKGASAAKQTGLEHARGEFIQYLDADDVLAVNKIEVQMNALKDQPGKIAVCKTTHFFGSVDNNIPSGDDFFLEYLDEPLNFLIKLYGGFDLRGSMIQPNAFLTPTSIVKKAGPWNSTISPCTDEDGEYFTRVILNSNGLVYQPDILNYYRKLSGKSLSGRVNELTFLNLVESIWIKHLHLLSYATSDSQITNIHNATYRSFEEVKVNIYYILKNVSSKILYYQNQLSPSLKPRNDKIGGNTINFISKTFGWKFAVWLQYIVRSYKNNKI
jgi:glycosyltransferase involved in cell wall biosynthesis